MKKNYGYRGLLLAAALPLCGCTIQVPTPEEGITLIPPGPFVIRGRTEEARVANSDCLVFRAESGVDYILSQAPRLPNEVFDEVTTVGASSRLVVEARSDIAVDCRGVTVVEVRDILELIPAPGS